MQRADRFRTSASIALRVERAVEQSRALEALRPDHVERSLKALERVRLKIAPRIFSGLVVYRNSTKLLPLSLV